MTAPEPRWEDEWDQHRPGPDDSEWDAYIEALPHEVDRLEEIRIEGIMRREQKNLLRKLGARSLTELSTAPPPPLQAGRCV